MTATVQILTNVQIPEIPDYFLLNDTLQEIPICGVDEKSLKAIGKLWTEALIKKAKKQTPENKTKKPIANLDTKNKV